MRDRKGKDIEFDPIYAVVPRTVKLRMDQHLRRRDESQRKFLVRALERQIEEDKRRPSDDDE